MTYKLGILKGDDIGLEVVPVAVQVMKEALAKFPEVKVEWVDLPIGYTSYLDTGETFPDATFNKLKELTGWILGPIGHMAYPKNDPKAINPHPIIRRVFDMYSNIRPSRSYPNVKSVHKDVDLVVVRENNEGFQPDRNMFKGTGEFMPNPDLAMSVRVISRRNSMAVAETAFQLAMERKKKVTAIHKNTVFKLGCGLFVECCRQVAERYPEVEFDELIVDSAAAALVMKPQKYDVLVTTNMFGDILSDLTSGLVGGLGMAPGLCVGGEYSMAQATHGSAPDIAGKQIANPYAMVMSGKMLLEWLGVKHKDPALLQASKLIEESVERVFAKGIMTRDLGGNASTNEMGEAICREINEQFSGVQS
ncbi:isocitrate/isopropylmalate family dehydrogenase [Caldibacillus lycopersici]|uniref:Isocitrate/isopropylmalate family dehydrogenase n=1 Tax=Perspicuibacillus lycopersici TaxID=1325689 RepID=A0AAE3IZI4_9BACI|nr:isocitrate/isopropylmalate family dehydrogenase [Perspicuibacillus lycopersici]MCU9614925.1 isocitrate/isopropylmalate family dehydrogenase [Perspicuibacillus lycopersici]